MKIPYFKGLVLAGGAAFISGIANFLNAQLVKGMDPLIQNVVKNGLVGIAIFGLLVITGKWKGFRQLSQKQILRLIVIAVVGGSVPFVLFFTGVKMIGAVPGSMIHKSMMFWLMFLAVPFLGEKISWKLFIGAALLYVSNFMWGFRGLGTIGIGHLMAFTATLLWAVETVIVKKSFKDIDTDVLLTARMGGGAVILTAIMFITGKTPLLIKLTTNQWVMLIVVALLLFGYVMTWYRALKNAPAIQVSSILVAAAVITNALDTFSKSNSLTFSLLIQILVMFSGVLFITLASRDNDRKVDLSYATA